MYHKGGIAMEDRIYQEELVEHYKRPRNRKSISDATFISEYQNHSCGDKLVMEGIIKDDILTDIGFAGAGCVISQAAASMLTEHCIGKSVQEVLGLKKDDILKLIGVQLGPTRLKCALLGLEVLQQGLLQYEAQRKE
jgi:nitrogen fixation protein NifU and related proteins